MNGYQPPLVPQSAVTFGDERLVDPWAETMLRNTCSNFQVQNMALQQENAALKTKNQSLQQQRANSIFKVADRAYLREFSAYRTEHFVKFPDERYYLVRENGFGAPYEVTKPLSDCTEFSARYVFDPRDGSTLIEVQYRLPNGKRASFSIPAEKFRKNTLAQSFLQRWWNTSLRKRWPSAVLHADCTTLKQPQLMHSIHTRVELQQFPMDFQRVSNV